MAGKETSQQIVDDFIDNISKAYQDLEYHPHYFSADTKKGGKTRRALIGLDDNETYSESYVFWPEFESNRLSPTMLKLIDDHEGLTGYNESRVWLDIGLVYVENPPVFPTDERSMGLAVAELWHNLTGDYHGRTIYPGLAAEFLGKIDYSSLKPIFTEPLFTLV